MTTHRMIHTALAVTLITSLPLVATLPTQASSTSAASAARAPQCTSSDHTHSRVKRWVTLDKHTYAITHADRVRLEKHASYDRNRRVSFTRRVSTNLQGSATIHTEAGAFFAKASATVNTSVAHESESTSTRSFSDRFHIPGSAHAHRYVFYAGVDRFTMHWHRLQCLPSAPHPYERSNGKLNTYSRAEFSGVVACPHSAYGPRSEAYAAALAGGC